MRHSSRLSRKTSIRIPRHLFHGTARAFGALIEKRGLDPAGPVYVPPAYRKSSYSEGDFVYFTPNREIARQFAVGTAERTTGGPGQVFQIDTKKVNVEPDPLLPAGESFRHSGHVPAALLKSVEIVPSKRRRM